MKVKQSIKGIGPAVWYGLKWYFPQYTMPAELIWKNTKTLKQARKKTRKVARRLVDIQAAIESMEKQMTQLFAEQNALIQILDSKHAEDYKWRKPLSK